MDNDLMSKKVQLESTHVHNCWVHCRIKMKGLILVVSIVVFGCRRQRSAGGKANRRNFVGPLGNGFNWLLLSIGGREVLMEEDLYFLRNIWHWRSHTAGAIASIAFDEVVPVVDGNVVRVLARLNDTSSNPKDSAVTVKKFWQVEMVMVAKGITNL